MSGNTRTTFAGPQMFLLCLILFGFIRGQKGYDVSGVAPPRDRKVMNPAGFEITCHTAHVTLTYLWIRLLFPVNDFQNLKSRTMFLIGWGR